MLRNRSKNRVPGAGGPLSAQLQNQPPRVSSALPEVWDLIDRFYQDGAMSGPRVCVRTRDPVYQGPLSCPLVHTHPRSRVTPREREWGGRAVQWINRTSPPTSRPRAPRMHRSDDGMASPSQGTSPRTGTQLRPPPALYRPSVRAPPRPMAGGAAHRWD